MPTGLTGDIYEGKDMTLRGFALLDEAEPLEENTNV